MHRSLGAHRQLIMSKSGSAEDSQEKPDLEALGALPVILTHERENIYVVLSAGTHAPQTTGPPSGFITLGRLGSNISQRKALIGTDIKTLGTCRRRSIDVFPPTDVCWGHCICLWAWSQKRRLPPCCSGVLTLTPPQCWKAVTGAELLEIWFRTWLFSWKDPSDGSAVLKVTVNSSGFSLFTFQTAAGWVGF